MMKKTRFLFAALIVIHTLSASAQNLSTTIKVQAMDIGSAVINNDFNRFIKYMHPRIIEFAGGKENMKVKMDSASVMMKQFGVSFKRYWIGSPGAIVKHKGLLQAILPQTTTMITPFGEMTAETHMIVISPDNGKSWWFIDTNVYQVDKLKNVLPDLSPKLVIPPRKKPKLVPLEKE